MGTSFVELPISIIDVGVRMLLMPQDLIEDIAALIEDFDFPSANALVDETILALDRGGIAFDAKQIKTLTCGAARRPAVRDPGAAYAGAHARPATMTATASHTRRWCGANMPRR